MVKSTFLTFNNISFEISLNKTIRFNLRDNACQTVGRVNGFIGLIKKYNGFKLFIEITNNYKEKPNSISRKGIDIDVT